MIDGLIHKKDMGSNETNKIKKKYMNNDLLIYNISFEIISSKLNQNSSFMFDASNRLGLTEFVDEDNTSKYNHKSEKKEVRFDKKDSETDEIVNKTKVKFNNSKTKRKIFY